MAEVELGTEGKNTDRISDNKLSDVTFQVLGIKKVFFFLYRKDIHHCTTILGFPQLLELGSVEGNISDILFKEKFN